MKNKILYRLIIIIFLLNSNLKVSSQNYNEFSRFDIGYEDNPLNISTKAVAVFYEKSYKTSLFSKTYRYSFGINKFSQFYMHIPMGSILGIGAWLINLSGYDLNYKKVFFLSDGFAINPIQEKKYQFGLFTNVLGFDLIAKNTTNQVYKLEFDYVPELGMRFNYNFTNKFYAFTRLSGKYSLNSSSFGIQYTLGLGFQKIKNEKIPRRKEDEKKKNENKVEQSVVNSNEKVKNSNNNSSSNQKQVDYSYCSTGNCNDGFGTMVFPQSSGFKEYTGTWKKGYRDRQWNLIECSTLNCRFDKGKLTYSDGSYYDGSFDSDGNGLYQGYGYLYNTNGTYKKGDFFKGELNGNGEEKNIDGLICKGRFVYGKRQGVCTLTYLDGKVVKGRYWEGKFISEQDDISTAKFDNTITGINPSDKRLYQTISINNKEWLTENLNVTTYRNGDQIPQAKTEKELLDANSNQQPVWCYYDFNPSTETHYGKLYNWYAVSDPRGILPLGYIIPSSADWQSINNFNNFKTPNGRAQLDQSEGKEVGSGKINKRFFFQFQNGPSKEKKYDNVFGVPESELGFYWTTDIYKDQNNDRINVFVIGSDGKTQIDRFQRKGACISVRAIKGDHNYYEGSWLGNQKTGYGTEYYGVATDLKGYGTVFKGDKYEGLWEKGKQDGEGTIITSNGIKKTGLWKEGQFIGEWRLVDNRHKCYQCNINYSKSVKRTDAEISNIKKTTSSNEIGIYNVELYCSSACEAKAAAEQKAREERWAREQKQKQQNQQNSNSQSSTTQASVCYACNGSGGCPNCSNAVKKRYMDDRCSVSERNEIKFGYIICGGCYGLGFTTTNHNCDCPNGVGWCYEKDCWSGGCIDGWVFCKECNYNGNGSNLGKCNKCQGTGKK